MKNDHWNRKAKDFLYPHLEAATNNVKIATGFFTIQGYDLLRQALADKSVQIMVGFDEHSRERLKQILIADMMIHLSRWEVANRREAVLDLVQRIQNGRFQIVEHKENNWIDAKARLKDHAKIYILDEAKVIVGSSNLTQSGLLYNIEGMTVQEEFSHVNYFLKQFLTYWNAEDTVDLTQELLDALLAWLELRPPFDIYLKTIQLLIQDEPVEAPRENYKMPVRYQRVVIERLLRQLNDFQGAMLVASTGLGKTIMATHTALRLKNKKRIDTVLVFAPSQVQHEWKQSLRTAGINHDICTLNILDYSPRRKGKKTREMEEALAQVDDKYLIIIDESQYFRNKKRAKDGQWRNAFIRLNPLLRNRKTLVLLLTATPFSKGVKDLNNQLNLLPHTAERRYIQQNGQWVMPGMIDEHISPEAWRIFEGEAFFTDFINLPVATVISTSQVAKDFAEHTEEGDYILFGEEKRWVPKVSITKVKVPVFLEEQISQLIQKRIFIHKVKSFMDRNRKWVRSQRIIENQAEISWASSPQALKEVVSDTVKNNYEVEFIAPIEKRERLLSPVLEQIHSHSYQTDAKFQSLLRYVKMYYGADRKVIIFTERLPTAIYLEKSLAVSFPSLSVANCVRQIRDGYELKKLEEVKELIKGFAPIANADHISPEENSTVYHVFIATDAYSTGVNLQDASVVIHYDLAWTPDVLIQRTGRILRFWKRPRKVDVLIFVGDFQMDHEKQKYTHTVEERLRKLSSRSQEAARFSEIPILPEEDTKDYDSLTALSQVKIEELGLADPSQLEEFTGVSPFLRHITVLKENEDYARVIPEDITSAMIYPGNKALLYLLLRRGEVYSYLLYDIASKTMEDIKEDALLDLIQCTRETPIAYANADEIETHAQLARKHWEEENIPDNQHPVERICTLYLVPEGKLEEAKEILL